jgi:Tfp pilus assembly protein PilO
LNQREKIMIGLAVAVALVFGTPMVMSAFGSSESTEQAVARLQVQRRDKEQAAQRLEKQTDQLRPQVERMAWNVPPEQLRQEIVRKISNLAQASNVTLVSTRPLKPRSLDVITEVTVELHVSATLPHLVQFLFPLQQPGSRLTVDRLRLSATNTDTDLLDVDLNVSGYTLQVPAEAKAAGARSASQ